MDGPGGTARPGPAGGPVAVLTGPGTGHQGRAVRIGEPDGASPLPEADANVATATELRRQEYADTGRIETEYPHHAKSYQTVIWKDQGVVWDRPGHIGLKNGLGRPYLYLPVPAKYGGANVRKAELLWRADHYELALTFDTGQAATTETGEVAGIDLGEVHVAAITTSRRHALVLSGRLLRSFKQWRNKSHARISEKLDRCKKGSRRSKRLVEAKAKVSAKGYRQQRDFLHKAAKLTVDFCAAEGVRRIVVGDVRDIQTGVSLGKVSNQKISQWPHGQFSRYVTEKAARRGIAVDWIDEAYSTKTQPFGACPQDLSTGTAIPLFRLWSAHPPRRQRSEQHLLQGRPRRLR